MSKNTKYMNEQIKKKYDRIELIVPKGMKEEMKDRAEKLGLYNKANRPNISGYIQKLVEEDLKNGVVNMEIYKIYAKCCTRPRGKAIIRIDIKEAENLIQESIYEMINNEMLKIKDGSEEEINDQYSALYDKAVNFFKENGYFECGDFAVTITEEPERANMYGFMEWIFD